MLNQVNIIGNLGRDPEIRSMQNGDKVANLNIATTEKWKDRDGNRQEKTEWHRVVIFGNVAGVAEKYLRKGSKVFIQGKLATRKWIAKNGEDSYTTEIIISGFDGKLTMLDGPKDRQDSGYGHDSGVHGSAPSGNEYSSPDLDDDIPF